MFRISKRVCHGHDPQSLASFVALGRRVRFPSRVDEAGNVAEASKMFDDAQQLAQPEGFDVLIHGIQLTGDVRGRNGGIFARTITP